MMDDWSQFPVADAVEADAPSAPATPPAAAPTANTPSVPDGWSVEVVPDRSGVQRQYAVSPDRKTMVAVGTGHGVASPAVPQHDQTPGAPAQIAGVGAAENTPGELSDWSQFPEAPKEHSWIDELGIGARAALEGAGGTAQALDVPGTVAGKVSELFGLHGSPTFGELADMIGLPTAETNKEKAAAATIQGAAAAAPLALAGGPIIPALVGGAGAGLSGEAARQSGAGPVGQIAASLAGGGAAGLAAGVPRAAANLLPSNRTVLTPTMQAFEDEKVPPLVADVGGVASRMFSGIGNMTLGGIPLQIAARKSVEAARALRTRIADTIGNPFRTMEGQSDSTGAGLAAQRGLKTTLGEGGTKDAVGTKLYRAIPIAPEANAVITNSRAALADLNEGLTSNPELSELIQDKRLMAYQRAFNGETQHVPTGILDADGNALTRPVQKGGKLSWKDLQSFRSYVGKLAGRPTLQDDTSQEALRRLYAGLSEDMRATAAHAGPRASAAFSRANNYWRGLETRRAQILKPLLGDKMDLHGAAAFRQIEQWSTQDRDVFALGRALRSVPEQEASDVRATLFDRLGNATKGNQDGGGLVFSPASFVTHWNGLSSRAKSVLFPGADYRQSIDNMVRIASAQKGAEKFANLSKTGNAVNGLTLLKLLVSNPLAFFALSGTEVGAGLFLASPRVARWAASAPAKPNAPAMLAHINRLSVVAAAEPQIANEVLALQERLAQAFVPTRAAAGDNQDKSRAGPSRPLGPGGQ